jgi:hypothetical protein
VFCRDAEELLWQSWFIVLGFSAPRWNIALVDMQNAACSVRPFSDTKAFFR